MSDKKIQLLDGKDNLLFPKTKAELVQTSDGGNLGTVEVGAQANVIETIEINGKSVSVNGKKVNLPVPTITEMNAVRDDLNKAIGNVDIKAEALQESLDAKALELSESIDAKTGAVSDALEASTDALGISIKANAKQIENLKKLTQGKIYDFETDTTSAYVKGVPTGAAPYAAMKAVGGKTLVWNQLVNIKTTELSVTFNGITFTRIAGSYVIKASGTCEKSFWLSKVPGVSFRIPKGVIEEHKYLCWAKGAIGYKSAVGFTETGATGSANGAVIKNPLRTVNLDDFQMAFDNGTTYNISFIPQVYDLTLMFGAGNEPATVEEFNAMFPAEYYEYNEGEIVSAEVQNVKSVGKNLFNKNNFSFVKGYIDGSGAMIIIPSSSEDRTVITPIRPNYTYTIKFTRNPIADLDDDSQCAFYSDFPEKNTLSLSDRLYVRSGTTSVLFSAKAPKNAKYLAVKLCNVGKSDLNKCLDTLQIEIGDTATDYVPYKEENFPIPEAVKQLEGYGWSAGTAKNWVDFEKKVYHREVGRAVYNGSTSAVRSSSTPTYIVYLLEISQLYSGGVLLRKGSWHCQFINNHFVNSDLTGVGQSAWTNKASTNLSVSMPTSYETSEQVKEFFAANPLELYYELAEPEEIDISDILTDDNLIEVEQGGTLTFENIHGDSYHLPVPSDVEYMINLQEATA